MRTKIRIINRKFYVNKEKQTVTCKIKAYSAFNSPTGYYFTGTTDLNKTSTFISTARCSNGDKFDDNKGMRIAESKAKSVMFRYYKKMYLEIFNRIKTDIESLSQYSQACEFASNTELKHIKEIDGENN